MTKNRGNGDKNGLWTPCAQLLSVCVCMRIGSKLEDSREAFILPFLTSGQHTTLQNLSLWDVYWSVSFRNFKAKHWHWPMIPNKHANVRRVSSRLGSGEGREGFDLWHKSERLYTQKRKKIQHCNIISGLILCKPERLFLFVSEMNVGLGQRFLWAWGRLDDIEQSVCFIRYVAVFLPVSGISSTCYLLNLSLVEALGL